jgi:hypothetical protein
MEQDQMGCNQIGLNFELHPLQCRSQFQNKSKKVHYLLCMVELQSGLLSGIFTKEQSFSGADNSKNTESSISDPSSVTDVMTQIMSMNFAT